jgi:hypothetical protein
MPSPQKGFCYRVSMFQLVTTALRQALQTLQPVATALRLVLLLRKPEVGTQTRMRPTPKGTTIQCAQSVTFALVTVANRLSRRWLFVRRVCKGVPEKGFCCRVSALESATTALSLLRSLRNPEHGTLTRTGSLPKGLRIQCLRYVTLNVAKTRD